MTICLLMKSYSYTEMLDMDDDERLWWYDKVCEYREEEQDLYNKAK